MTHCKRPKYIAILWQIRLSTILNECPDNFNNGSRFEMLIRYKVSESGKRVPIARIYTKSEHGIDRGLVDRDAVSVVDRLKRQGYDTYIVGGAVRDLMLGSQPKDFDIATQAYPKQIRKVFWNSRVIGRRFKLVHVFFQEKIIEVSTFRSSEQGELGEHNVYGTIEEDAKRRDFTLNSLYYDPIEEQVLDFTDAFKDMEHRRIQSIIPLNVTFIEDPVRMIRCIKYAATTGFSIPFRLKMALRKHAKGLALCSDSRMTEEVFKILKTGHSAGILGSLIDYHMFRYMLPNLDASLQSGKNKALTSEFENSLAHLDSQLRHESDRIQGRASMIVALIDPFLTFPHEYENSHELFKEVFKQIKSLIHPITPPNYEVEKAVEILFAREGIKVPRNAVRKPKTPNKPQTGETRNAHAPSRRRGQGSAKSRSGAPRTRSSKKTDKNQNVALNQTASSESE